MKPNFFRSAFGRIISASILGAIPVCVPLGFMYMRIDDDFALYKTESICLNFYKSTASLSHIYFLTKTESKSTSALESRLAEERKNMLKLSESLLEHTSNGLSVAKRKAEFKRFLEQDKSENIDYIKSFNGQIVDRRGLFMNIDNHVLMECAAIDFPDMYAVLFPLAKGLRQGESVQFILENSHVLRAEVDDISASMRRVWSVDKANGRETSDFSKALVAFNLAWADYDAMVYKLAVGDEIDRADLRLSLDTLEENANRLWLGAVAQLDIRIKRNHEQLLYSILALGSCFAALLAICSGLIFLILRSSRHSIAESVVKDAERGDVKEAAESVKKIRSPDNCEYLVGRMVLFASRLDAELCAYKSSVKNYGFLKDELNTFFIRIRPIVDDIQKALSVGNSANISNVLEGLSESSEKSAVAFEKLTSLELSSLEKLLSDFGREGAQVQAIADNFSKIGAVAVKMKVVSDTLAGVAEQANLLGVNAAIEVGKNSGAGFRTLSERIRGLATRANVAVLDIDALYESISGMANSGAQSAKDFYGALNINMTMANELTEWTAGLREWGDSFRRDVQSGKESVLKTKNAVKAVSASVDFAAENVRRLDESAARLKAVLDSMRNV